MLSDFRVMRIGKVLPTTRKETLSGDKTSLRFHRTEQYLPPSYLCSHTKTTSPADFSCKLRTVSFCTVNVITQKKRLASSLTSWSLCALCRNRLPLVPGNWTGRSSPSSRQSSAVRSRCRNELPVLLSRAFGVVTALKGLGAGPLCWSL